MQKMKVIIIGAGGHGKVVADAIIKENKYELIGFADDNKLIGETVYLNYKVVCAIQAMEIQKFAAGFIIAIGNNKIRAEKFDDLKLTIQPIKVIHPFSCLANDISVGEGTVILAGAVINPGTKIGFNCIINSHVLIDHDCVLNDHVHIGQSVSLGSGNQVESFIHFEQGKVIKSVFY
jgi:sugar O-acyltransferase (sialic acid O-acetyltransferase NeuD family)